MPVAVQTDKRFHRAHTRPIRHKPWSRWWVRAIVRGVVACLVIAAGYRGMRAAMHLPLFAISRITVHGNERLSTGEVNTILSGMRGENLLDADLDVWRARLMQSAWVRDATLHRSLPSTLDVTIVERRPIGIARIGAELYLVDARGMVIDAYGPNYGDLNLPIIDGLGAPATDADATGERAQLAASLIAAVSSRPDLARRISQIDVSDVRDAVVLLSGDPARIRLGDTDFVQRLQSYLQVASALRDEVPAIDYVDLRFGRRVYVGPAAGAGKSGGGGRTPDPRRQP